MMRLLLLGTCLLASLLASVEGDWVGIRHSKGCWKECGNKGGLCEDVCGSNGYCCRKRHKDCAKEQRIVSTRRRHSCVKPADFVLTANCDNNMIVFADEVEVGNNSDWTVASEFTIPGETKVVTIQCTNTGGPAGIIASGPNGMDTDASWTCGKADMDITEWTPARELTRDDANIVTEHLEGGGLSPNATWIWYGRAKCTKNCQTKSCMKVVEYEVGPIEVGEDEGGADDSPDDAGAPAPEFKQGVYGRHPKTNAWHRVIISQVDGGGGTSVYKWQNAAGVEWNLYQYDGDDTLYVGTECPYYKEPYNWSTTTFNATGIVGPFDEFYYYESDDLVFPQ